MNVVLFYNQEHQELLPLTFMKPAGELRMGILTFRERWGKLLNAKTSHQSPDYLNELFPIIEKENNVYINPCYFPTAELIDNVKNLEVGNAISYEGEIIAFHGNSRNFNHRKWKVSNFKENLIHIRRPYDLFNFNHQALDFDFELITKNRKSQEISSTNGLIHQEKIFLEEGAKVEFAILNATDGPIYLGKNAEICEGSMVRGGLALCESAKLNMGTKVYGATSIGPHCKVGGEINNSILTGYSNKGHDGFLGNSVIGEWCNLGADTNNSNLKNNYGNVKLWNYSLNRMEVTGLQFCGLIMGDHAKSAINTQFNTGTVVEPFANIFHAGFPPTKIEKFSWGGRADDNKFRLESAFEIAEKMMIRRNITLTKEMKKVIEYIFNLNENKL